MAKEYEGYSWIKVPKYVMDESKTWEERYKELEQHHIVETTLLNQQSARAGERLGRTKWLMTN